MTAISTLLTQRAYEVQCPLSSYRSKLWVVDDLTRAQAIELRTHFAGYASMRLVPERVPYTCPECAARGQQRMHAVETPYRGEIRYVASLEAEDAMRHSEFLMLLFRHKRLYVDPQGGP